MWSKSAGSPTRDWLVKKRSAVRKIVLPMRLTSRKRAASRTPFSRNVSRKLGAICDLSGPFGRGSPRLAGRSPPVWRRDRRIPDGAPFDTATAGGFPPPGIPGSSSAPAGASRHAPPAGASCHNGAWADDTPIHGVAEPPNRGGRHVRPPDAPRGGGWDRHHHAPPPRAHERLHVPDGQRARRPLRQARRRRRGARHHRDRRRARLLRRRRPGTRRPDLLQPGRGR